MAVFKYNPKRITASFKGTVNGRDFAVQLTGYMDGSMLTAEYDEDAVTKHQGDQGDTSVVLNCNRGAKFTVQLVQGSPSNKLLSDLVPNGKIDYLPIGTFSIEDLNGSTRVKAVEAWIARAAKIDFGKGITGRSWMFETGDADITVGGAEEAA